MVPGVDGVNVLASRLCQQLVNQALGNAVDAAHRGHNPYLVAHAHVAVLAAIALKGSVLVFNAKFLVDRIVCVLERTAEIGLEVVLVHPVARLQVAARMADGVAVLDDVLALLDVAQQHLVACRHVLGQYDTFAANLNDVAFFLLD